MAVILKIMISIVFWYLLSFATGGLFLRSEDTLFPRMRCVVYGMLSMFALSAVVAVPMKLLQCSLQVFCLVTAGLCVLLAAVAVVWKRQQLQAVLRSGFQIKSDICVIFAAMVLQILFTICFMYTGYETTGTLAAMTKSWEENLLPDFSRLFVLVFAGWGKLIEVHPVILANTFSGLFLLPVCCFSWILSGEKIFRGNRKKALLFAAAVLLFYFIGSAYDVNFQMFESRAFFEMLLFPFAVMLARESPNRHVRQRLPEVGILLAAGVLTGRNGLTILGVAAAAIVCSYGVERVIQNRQERAACHPSVEKDEEGDFMNTKKGKLLFAGYLILLPALLVLVLAIFKLNQKINSVYEITQEMKAATLENGGQEKIVSQNEISGNEISSNVISADEGSYTLSCFSEEDGKSFITFDTKSEKCYQLYQHDINEDAGGLSYIIELPSGGLVLIDGGYYADGIKLHDFIVSHGGRVEAWFLTHPHYDHIGAFLYCMTEGRSDIEVDQVYYSPFTDDFLENSSSVDEKLEYEAFDFADFEKIRETEQVTAFSPLKAGDTAEIEGLRAECLSSFDAAVDDINDNSLVMKLSMNDISMMITGDISEKAVERMTAVYGESPEIWDVNFLQVPHHGYTGAGEKLYDLTQPEFVLLDCSTTEYNNDILGIHSETAARLHDRGIGIVKRFEGTNVVMIK